MRHLLQKLMPKEKFKFTIPIYLYLGKKKYFLNLNQYRNWHYHVNNKLKVLFKEILHNYNPLMNSQNHNDEISINYVYYAPDKRNRDLMNVIAVVDKYFQDALVVANLIKDDNTSIIKKIQIKYGGVDKENPRIEAELKDL